MYPFKITEHVIDAQYIRDSPRATATPDAKLKLCVKQYTPIDNPNPQPGDVTLLAAAGTGLPKEVYEPLWEDLLARSKQDGFRIRGIWMADAVNQGASGVLNEEILGNDSTWSDHARDLLQVVSHFRAEMPQPIMGVGHSAGAGQLVFASIFHPSLFSSLIFLEPFVNDDQRIGGGGMLIIMTTEKRDIWRSREEAKEKSKRALRTWDPRAFERWVQHGYRELPTTVYPDKPAQPGAVTLTTTKHQETMTYTYVDHKPATVVKFVSEDGSSDEKQESFIPGRQVYRREPILGYKLLPHLAPGTLFISGERSPVYQCETHDNAVKITGTGYGGSGGAEKDRIRHVVIDKGSHTLPMEKVGATAEAMGPWIQKEVQLWKEEGEKVKKEWGSLSTKQKSSFSPEWYETIEIAKANL
ncbi:hypothetical protein N7493_002385 [Penicillium malachiteum]|uniref:AB hydrolase-1 domain-containing protein n=1 Tax=Penicillium malachiteum TaxID=1324776 RepID=A0AAD6MYN3_9EURO|nr:hypothetical protein N7493_002385 [Penicillium malachiteum]